MSVTGSARTKTTIDLLGRRNQSDIDSRDNVGAAGSQHKHDSDGKP